MLETVTLFPGRSKLCQWSKFSPGQAIHLNLIPTLFHMNTFPKNHYNTSILSLFMPYLSLKIMNLFTQKMTIEKINKMEMKIENPWITSNWADF